MDWTFSSVGNCTAPDPNGNGYWAVWFNTIGWYSVVHVHADGTREKVSLAEYSVERGQEVAQKLAAGAVA